MLQHNWALIEGSENGTASVFFFHDEGEPIGFAGYSRAQLRGRCAIVDSLKFESVQLAEEGLSRNGFRLHRVGEIVGSDVKPSGNFFDLRTTEEGVYSTQGYWK
jgi:hypothetical protein